jgi:hypothetical protein
MQLEDGKIKLSGSFGVFFPGRLVIRFYDEHGRSAGMAKVADVNPSDPVSLDAEVTPRRKPARLSVHLEDDNGVDHGSLGEVQVGTGEIR